MDDVDKKSLVNTRRLFIFNIHHFIRYLFSWQIFPFIAVFSLSYLSYPLSPILYLFVYVAVMMMVYKLAFDVLAYVAAGDMSPHHVRQNYLVTNAIAVKVLAIALLIEFAVRYMEHKGVSTDYRYYFILISTFITPAIYMSLALTNSLFFSLNPVTVFKVIKTAPLSYFLFVIFWVGTIILHEIIINPLVYKYMPVFIDGMVSVFIEYLFLILNFHIMGYIIFQKRHEFDLEGIGFNKVEGDFIDIEQEKENPAYKNISNLLDNDEEDRALAIIMQLKNDGDHSSRLDGLYKRAMNQKLYTPTNKEVAIRIHNRLHQNLTRQAFKMLREHLDSGEEYTESSPSDILLLAKYAAANNMPKYIARIVRGFHEKYPYHEDIVDNYFILAKSLYNNEKTRDQSIELLIELIRDYPNDPKTKEVKAWYKGVEMLRNKK